MSHEISFEEEIIKEAVQVLKDVVPKITQIWRQLGFSNLKQKERFGAAVSHHKELWESMLEEEQSNRKKIVGSIDRLGRQYHQLCRELGTVFKEFDPDAPLLEIEKLLQNAISELSKEKEERMKTVRVLFAEEDRLCGRLGLEPLSLNRDRIPTSEQFTQLQQHVIQLKNETQTRQETFMSTREAIRELMHKLEMSARNSFEVDLLVSDVQTAPLTASDLEKLKDLHHKLSIKLEQNQHKAAELRSTIEVLWDRLGVENDHRGMFRMQNTGSAPSTLSALEQELSRLQELKRQNLERFVKAVRQDLLLWWDKCCVSHSQREHFCHFTSDIYSEELLELHEMEVDKYKALYGNNKEIFLKVGHRESLWKKMEEIEARGRDPSRLFGNRGCALLQEEKERKKIMKELPRVEGQLVELLNQYEREHGTILLIRGGDYRNVIEEQWKIYEEQKENEKLQRQRERAEKLEAEAKGGAKPTTPMKRRLGTTALKTAMESPKAKHRKLITPTTAPQPRASRRILTEATLNAVHPSNQLTAAHDTSTISTYSAFTENLAARVQSASSPQHH